MDPDQARALVSVASTGLFDEAQRRLDQGESVLQIRVFLEQKLPIPTCLAVLDCICCQQRYLKKFDCSKDWLLTRQAAEQASASEIARWRTGLLASAAKSRDLTELGCGIGGDSVFLSRQFALTAYEADEARLILAQSNIEALNNSHSHSLNHKNQDLAELSGGILFADPARRENGRISHPEQWQPPLSKVVECYRSGRFEVLGVKCAPGLKTADISAFEAPVSSYFISSEGQLKEAFLVIGQGMESSSQAVLFETGSPVPTVVETCHQDISHRWPENGLFLHNPDPAILRARALDTLANKLDAGIVHPKIGYLIGSRPCQDNLADSFQIEAHQPLNWTNLKTWLKKSEWTEYEYLGRGVPFSQQEVRKRLPKLKKKKLKQSNKGSIIIYRTDEGYQALLARRCEKGKPSSRKTQST